MTKKEMKTLIIEDSKLISKIHKLALKEENCESIVASNGKEAYEALEKEKFNLVLLDIELPDISGIKILESIRKKYNQMQLPVIVVSAKTSEDFIIKSLGLGANDFISKPFKKIQLQLKIRNLLKSQQLNAELEQKNLEIETLFKGSQLLLESTDFINTAKQIFNYCCRLIDAKSGSLTLFNKNGEHNNINFLIADGFSHSTCCRKMPAQSICKKVYETGETIYDNNYVKSHDCIKQISGKYVPQNNIMLSPLKQNGKTIGLLGLEGKTDDFTDYDAKIITSFAELISVSLINSRNIELLKNSEERYKRIFDNSETLIMEIEAETYNILNCNPKIARILETTPEKLECQNLKKILSPETFKLSEQQILKALRENKTIEYEFQQNKHYLYNTVTPIISKNNKTILVVSHDITKLKLSELQNLKFKTAIEQSSNSIVITDTDGNIEYVNQAFNKLTQYKNEEVFGKNPRLLQSGEQDNEFYEEMWETISSGKSWQGEFHNKRKDDSLFWEKATINPIKNNNNEIINYLAIKEDITQQKKITQALEESEKKYNILFSQALNPKLLINNQGRILQFNDLAFKLLEYEKNEFAKLKISDFDIINSEKTIIEKIKSLVKGKEYIFETKYKTKKGKILDVIVNSVIVIINNEELLFSSFHDITPIKKAETEIKNYTKQLEESNATKDRFISILAHDLKNPFNSLLGFSKLLMANIEDYDNATVKKFAKIINKTTHETLNLLNNLLEWSRSQRNKIAFNPKKNNLYNLVKETYLFTKHFASEKSIIVNLDIPKEINIVSDGEMIKTIIRNLLSNAIKFTKNNGTINLSATQNSNFVTIKISDTGIGMTEQRKNLLFKIGEIKSEKGTNGERGTGFGLLLCKEFIEKHKGTLEIESEVGKGSVFTIQLPLGKL